MALLSIYDMWRQKPLPLFVVLASIYLHLVIPCKTFWQFLRNPSFWLYSLVVIWKYNLSIVDNGSYAVFCVHFAQFSMFV